MVTAQVVEPPHGDMKTYRWHYRHEVPMCTPCREAFNVHQREERARLKKLRSAAPLSVVPVGWPCADCVWSGRLPTSDGRVISWRLECCPKHRGYW